MKVCSHRMRFKEGNKSMLFPIVARVFKYNNPKYQEHAPTLILRKNNSNWDSVKNLQKPEDVLPNMRMRGRDLEFIQRHKHKTARMMNWFARKHRELHFCDKVKSNFWVGSIELWMVYTQWSFSSKELSQASCKSLHWFL